MRRWSEVNRVPGFICAMWWGELLPVNFFISLHIVEQETGSFVPAINALQDRFLAERTSRTRAIARLFLYSMKSDGRRVNLCFR